MGRSSRRKAGKRAIGNTSAGEPLRFVQEDALKFDGDECLLWPFSTGRGGYARIRHNGKMITVSRLVCEHEHGAPPTPKHQAAHSCGNGREGCVNPKHLRWATRSENEADKLTHGTSPRGERNGQAKLTETGVREIISLGGVVSNSDIARRFSVSRRNVGMILSGKSWAWLSLGDGQ